MVQFRQKNFTEYDAMRLLYTELNRDGWWRDRIKVIDRNSVIQILRGNNILIERFVISTSLFGKDKYRLYLKIGAQAKLPDEVRLPEVINQRRVLKKGIELKAGNGPLYQKNNSETVEDLLLREKLFGKKKNKGNNNNNQQNNGGGVPYVNPILNNTTNGYDIMYEIRSLIGEAIKYDKRDRSLVLEFDGPKENAIRNLKEALNILPFGLNYNIYLLNS